MEVCPENCIWGRVGLRKWRPRSEWAAVCRLCRVLYDGLSGIGVVKATGGFSFLVAGVCGTHTSVIRVLFWFTNAMEKEKGEILLHVTKEELKKKKTQGRRKREREGVGCPHRNYLCVANDLSSRGFSLTCTLGTLPLPPSCGCHRPEWGITNTYPCSQQVSTIIIICIIIVFFTYQFCWGQSSHVVLVLGWRVPWPSPRRCWWPGTARKGEHKFWGAGTGTL